MKKVLKSFNISGFSENPPSMEKVRGMQSPDNFFSSLEVKVEVKVERMLTFSIDPPL